MANREGMWNFKIGQFCEYTQLSPRPHTCFSWAPLLWAVWAGTTEGDVSMARCVALGVVGSVFRKIPWGMGDNCPFAPPLLPTYAFP